MELRIALTPKQREFDAAIKRYREVLYGGAKGGGKSHGLRLIMLKRRFEYPNSIGYLFRKTFPELEANHISPLFEQFPALREYYNEGKKTLRLPNGSQLRFAYAEATKDIKKFQGREIHDLAIEECGEWPFEHYDELRSCNRSSIPGIEPRVILTANPGGIAHKWLKRLFIEKRYEGAEIAGDYHFIPARVFDNPALMKADPQYASRLAAIKNETLRRAFLDGDWDISAGAFFEQLSRNIHFVDPFPIPEHWPRFGAYDYGFNHPAAWGSFAADGDGNTYMVRELIRAKMEFPEQARLIKEWPEFKRIGVFDAGHDCWAKKKGADPTIAEDFAALGVHLRQANIDRLQGAAQLRAYLRYENVNDKVDSKETKSRRIGPRLFIFRTCPVTFDCISRMIHDPNRVEDVLKVDSVDGDPYTGDDAYDMTRYALMSRPRLAISPESRQSRDYRPRRERSSVNWRTA